MLGGFRATARKLLEWTGFDRSQLPKTHQDALNKVVGPGGGAEKVL